MAAPMVREGAGTSGVTGTLFAGKIFWISRRTPSRTSYVELIESNGGTRTEAEEGADYKIADHVRTKFAPQGSVSYTFLDACRQAGALVDDKPHLIWPETNEPRPIGSVQRPAKGLRNPFTAEDDRVLADWVKDSEGALRGNVIFQQLEAKHPNHTWQSWRDRYVKGRVRTPRESAASNAEAPEALSPSAERQPQTDENQIPAPTTAAAAPAEAAQQPSLPSAADETAADQSTDRDENHAPNTNGSAADPVVNGQDSSNASETLRVDAPYPPISGMVDDEEDEEVEEERADATESEEVEDVGEEDLEAKEAGKEDEALTPEEVDSGSEGSEAAAPSFTEDDFQTLLDGSKSIMGIEPNRVEEAWAAYAQSDSLGRNGEQWQSFWEDEVRALYLQQKEERRIAGNPSPDGSSVASESEDEASDDSDSASDSQSSSRPETPQPAIKEEGIEILADDGKRHLSTPIRPQSAGADKRKRDEEGERSNSTSPVGERSPLKKRRLEAAALQAKPPSVVEDSEVEQATQTQGAFETAPTDKIDVQAVLVDLSQMSDGAGYSDSESSEAFEDSAQFETAPTARVNAVDEEDSSEDEVHKTADTQGHIDAQLMSEMSSAAQQTSPPRSQRQNQPSSRINNAVSYDIASSESQEAGSASDETDLDEVIVTRRSPVRRFAPAAFQTSPSSQSQSQQHRERQRSHQRSTPPTLLPAFSSPPKPLSAKARGKQRRLPSQEDYDEDEDDLKDRGEDRDDASNTLRGTPSSNDLSGIPAWVHTQLAQGTSMSHIQTAVKAASGELDQAERVLRVLARGDPIPPGMRGIWTDKDDAALRRGNETALIPLAKKHGHTLIRERREFLRAFEGSDEE